MVRDLPAPIGAGVYNVYTGVTAAMTRPVPPCRRRPSSALSRPGSAPSAAAGWWCRSDPTAGGPSARGTAWWTRPTWRRADDRAQPRPPRSRGGGRSSRRGGSAPAGVLVGGLWAWIAPPIHGVVALTHDGDRLHDYLGDEPDHFFVAAFLMLGLLNVVAAVAAVLAWQWRAHRGPGMVAGLCTGVVIAAAAAVGVGVLLVHLRYGA